MEIDPPMCISADFQFMNIPVDDENQISSNKKLFLNQPFAIVSNIVEKSEYDSLNLEKKGKTNNLVMIVLNVF